jgi:hypothetical protein
MQAWFLGNSDRALKLLESGLQRTPLSTLPALSRPYESLAQVYALAGRADLARGMLTDFDKNAESMIAENAVATRHLISATIAIAEKRYGDATKEARAADFGSCTICAEPILGYAYDLAQQPDSAIASLTRYTSSTSIVSKMNIDQYFLALSYRRLGQLWEDKGDKVRPRSTTRSSSTCGRTRTPICSRRSSRRRNGWRNSPASRERRNDYGSPTAAMSRSTSSPDV